jgi:hypothetical protein
MKTSSLMRQQTAVKFEMISEVTGDIKNDM